MHLIVLRGERFAPLFDNAFGKFPLPLQLPQGRQENFGIGDDGQISGASS